MRVQTRGGGGILTIFTDASKEPVNFNIEPLQYVLWFNIEVSLHNYTYMYLGTLYTCYFQMTNTTDVLPFVVFNEYIVYID